MDAGFVVIAPFDRRSLVKYKTCVLLTNSLAEHVKLRRYARKSNKKSNQRMPFISRYLLQFYFRESEPRPGLGIYNPVISGFLLFFSNLCFVWRQPLVFGRDGQVGVGRGLRSKTSEILSWFEARKRLSRRSHYFREARWNHIGSHQRVYWRTRSHYDDDESTIVNGTKLYR